MDAALDRRARLLNDRETNAWRAFNGRADGLDGLVIEKLGDVLVVQTHEGALTLDEAALRSACEHMSERLSARAVYRKVFPRDRSASEAKLRALHADPKPWLGERVESEFSVIEDGVRLLVRPYDGFAVGLFLEHRANRRRIRALAAERRVLNAFAYTCAFSVNAALGGAAQVVSVDVSTKFLDWGRRNFAANNLDPAAATFIRADIFEYYRRAKRQRRVFDLIILDPPTFSRDKRSGRVFVLGDDLDRLVAGALELLAAQGCLLLSTNHRGTPRRRLEQTVIQAGRARSCRIVARPRLPADFHGDQDYAKSILARVN